MSKRDRKLKGAQKGAQQHAEGQHGPKAHEEFLENIHTELFPERDDVVHHDDTGRHRLFEDREQHDEADKNSELMRKNIEFQKKGGDRDEFDDVVNGRSPSGPN